MVQEGCHAVSCMQGTIRLCKSVVECNHAGMLGCSFSCCKHQAVAISVFAFAVSCIRDADICSVICSILHMLSLGRKTSAACLHFNMLAGAHSPCKAYDKHSEDNSGLGCLRYLPPANDGFRNGHGQLLLHARSLLPGLGLAATACCRLAHLRPACTRE